MQILRDWQEPLDEGKLSQWIDSLSNLVRDSIPEEVWDGVPDGVPECLLFAQYYI